MPRPPVAVPPFSNRAVIIAAWSLGVKGTICSPPTHGRTMRFASGHGAIVRQKSFHTGPTQPATSLTTNRPGHETTKTLRRKFFVSSCLGGRVTLLLRRPTGPKQDDRRGPPVWTGRSGTRSCSRPPAARSCSRGLSPEDTSGPAPGSRGSYLSTRRTLH